MNDIEQNAVAHLSPVWTHLTNIVVDHAEGIYLYDTNGTRYADFTAGIGVTNTGHCHPKVVDAIQKQASRLLHGQANIVFHPPMLQLVDELRNVLPSALDSFFFSNSGAEAVEASIKLARQASGKPNIIVFQGSFHGRTIGTMSLTTSKTVYRFGFQPLMSGVFVSPYPYAYRYGWDKERMTDFALTELQHLLKSQTAPEETAAILIEPVLGEGGYVVPPKRFMKALRQICDEHNILLIFDEVQTGFGRTGKFFALEHFDAMPDILVMAKGLASGLPLSGIATSKTLMSKWKPGTHGGTYGGNAIATAAAVATIQALKEDKLVKNSALMGERLQTGLRRLQTQYPVIGDVRGLGLMIATEFTDAAVAKKVQQACLAQNLLLLTCGTDGQVIRWIPPLSVNAEQIDDALTIFSEALKTTIG